MPSYRLEYAKTNRAGCKGTTCQKEKTKITKGMLKLGVWLEIASRDLQFWSYRHWGCVTLKQLENIKETVGDDFDLLDGYEDLTEEDQERVRKAVEEGHVADEDCIGIDPELNRPGAAEAKKAAEKEAKKKEDKEYLKVAKKREELENEEDEREETALVAQEMHEDAARGTKRGKAKTKKKSSAKAKTAEERVGNEHETEAAPKKRKRGKKENDDGTAKPAKRIKSKKTTQEDADDEIDGTDADHPEEEPDDTVELRKPKKRGRPAAVKKSQDSEESVTAPSKQKRGRPAKGKKDTPVENDAPLDTHRSVRNRKKS